MGLNDFSVIDSRRKILLNAPHIDTSSGGIASFETDMKSPLKECKVFFNPIQEGEGTPSFSNIRLISGWDGITVCKSGKNLVNIRLNYSHNNNGVAFVHSSDGLVHASGKQSSSANAQTIIKVNYTDLENDSETFSDGCLVKYGGCPDNTDGVIRWDIYPWDYTTGARPKQSSTSSTNAVSCYYESDVGVAYIPAGHKFALVARIISTNTLTLDDLVFCPYAYLYNETDMSFEKPERETINISWANTIGTVYGGSLDVTTGELIVDKTSVTFDGTESWRKVSGESVDSDFFYYTHNESLLGNDIKKQGCSHYKSLWIATNNNTIGCSTTQSSETTGICFRPDLTQISTVEQWTAFLAGQYSAGTPVQCWFTKVNPDIYQLTPQQLSSLKGINNIWSNANDDIEIKYWTH